jgi:antirestriction factor ArdC-like protein
VGGGGSSAPHSATRPTPRAAQIAVLHDQVSEQVEQLTADPQWRAMLDAAAKFHTYSLGNQLLIARQGARLGISPTRVAGFTIWKALGRSVVKGSTGLAVLAPCTYTPKNAIADLAAPAAATAETAWEPSGGNADRPAGPGVLRGFRVLHVFDITQTALQQIANDAGLALSEVRRVWAAAGGVDERPQVTVFP